MEFADGHTMRLQAQTLSGAERWVDYLRALMAARLSSFHGRDAVAAEAVASTPRRTKREAFIVFL